MTQLTFLVISFSSIGIVNAGTGITKELLRRGHRVVFLLNSSFRHKLTSQGFEVFVRQHEEAEQNPGETLAKQMLDIGMIGPKSPLQKIELFVEKFLELPRPEMVKFVHNLNTDVEEAIKACKPNALIVDQLCLVPAIYYGDIPWVNCYSTNPLTRLSHEDLPPGGSGYPSDGRNKRDWPIFRQTYEKLLYSKSFNDILEEMGYQRYPNDSRMPEKSALFTVYAYPEELNYPQVRSQSDLFNLECFNPIRDIGILNEIVPHEFYADRLDGKFSGKWIYLGLGSMCPIDVQLMKRLVSVLATTPHKYIVAKGPLHSQYDLPRNMWGERFVPQTRIIPLVDLVITHGGNNTVTEVFSQGKPMIVLPVYWDQFDNAQRLHETGHGIRLDAYNFVDKELIDGIDRLLGDEELLHKLQIAARRIQASQAHVHFCERVESLLMAKINKKIAE